MPIFHDALRPAAEEEEAALIRRALRGEAEAVRDLVLRRRPEPAAMGFLLLGDCNDGPRSRPVLALQRRGEACWRCAPWSVGQAL